jgi:hypothetical protein
MQSVNSCGTRPALSKSTPGGQGSRRVKYVDQSLPCYPWVVWSSLVLLAPCRTLSHPPPRLFFFRICILRIVTVDSLHTAGFEYTRCVKQTLPECSKLSSSHSLTLFSGIRRSRCWWVMIARSLSTLPGRYSKRLNAGSTIWRLSALPTPSTLLYASSITCMAV